MIHAATYTLPPPPQMYAGSPARQDRLPRTQNPDARFHSGPKTFLDRDFASHIRSPGSVHLGSAGVKAYEKQYFSADAMRSIPRYTTVECAMTSPPGGLGSEGKGVNFGKPPSKVHTRVGDVHYLDPRATRSFNIDAHR